MELTNFTSKAQIATYTNKELEKHTKAIYKYGTTVRNCMYRIAKEIVEVEQSKCYIDDGFKTVHEWTNHAFGIKKTVSYNMLKIGKEYLQEVQNGKAIEYKSNLTDSDTPLDYSHSQLQVILPLGHDKADELSQMGVINPEMTVAELKKVVKEELHQGKGSTGDSDAKDIQEQDEIKPFIKAIDFSYDGDGAYTITMTVAREDIEAFKGLINPYIVR